MKHSLDTEPETKKAARSLKKAAVVLAICLVFAGGIFAWQSFNNYQQEQLHAQEEQVQAQHIASQVADSFEAANQAQQEAQQQAKQEAIEQEAKWLSESEKNQQKALEHARKAAVEQARQDAIDAARSAYDEEVEAERQRRASDFSDLILIGDSVMEYATGQLYGRLPGATVNAIGGRSLETGAPGNGYDPADGVMDIVRSTAGSYKRYVIGTGNNEGAGVSLDVGEEIVSLLGSDAEIFLITQTSLRNPTSMENTNATIAALCEEHANVLKIDWRALTEGREGELVMADGVHPLPQGVAEYVELIYEAVVAYDIEPFDPESVAFDPASVEFNEQEALEHLRQSTDIMGESLISPATMAKLYESRNVVYPAEVYAEAGAATIEDFCKLCVEEADAEGVRTEVLFAQAMHETAWLQFGNQVSVEQCNFGGLGAVNSGGAGEVFADVREGLRAQVQHLKAYASKEELNNEIVDTRFDLVERGSAPTVFDLGGRWAWPGDGYGDAIMTIMQKLYGMEYLGESAEEGSSNG